MSRTVAEHAEKVKARRAKPKESPELWDKAKGAMSGAAADAAKTTMGSLADAAQNSADQAAANAQAATAAVPQAPPAPDWNSILETIRAPVE